MFGFGVGAAQEFFIIQSAENKDKVIEEMKNLKYRAFDIYDNNAYDLIRDALERFNFTSRDFTDSDWEEIMDAAKRIA